MKICPFISHMIGEEHSSVLEVEHGQAADAAPEVPAPADAGAIMLGYDDGDGDVAVATKAKARRKSRSKSKAKSKTAAKGKESPLFCLKDTCRFYQKKGGSCMFDKMHEMMADSSKAGEADKPVEFDTSGLEKIVESTGATVTKELDKFWKFQTKSVSELIASIGEIEKNHDSSVSDLGKSLEKKLDGLKGAAGSEGIDELKTGIGKISKIESRLDAIDELKGSAKKLDEVRSGIRKLESLGKDMQKLDEMRGQLEQVSGLRDDVKQLGKLRDEMKNLGGLRDDVKQLGKLRDEMKNLGGLRDDVKQLGDLQGEMKQLESLRTGITSLQETVEAREESSENFATTISEIIVNIEEGLKGLRDESRSVASRIDGLEKSMEDVGGIGKSVEQAIGRHMSDSGAPDLTDDVRGISSEIQEFVESTKRFERSVEDWQSRLESRLDEIGRQQAKIASLVESNHRQQADDASHDRKEARKLNNLGVNSFHNGDLEMARDHFQRAVQADDRFAEAYNNLGLVFTEIEEEDKASEAFERAIELNPDLPAAYSNLGYVFYRQGRYEEAVEKYSEAIDRSSSSSSAYTNLGNAYYKMGKYDEARQAWEKALDLDPDNEKASRNLDRLD
jgi:tetratricopeptide (TPR) repeat protein